MWRHHPRPQHIRGEPESLAGVDNRTEIRLFLVAPAAVAEDVLQFSEASCAEVFELTQSAVIWKKNAFPDRG